MVQLYREGYQFKRIRPKFIFKLSSQKELDIRNKRNDNSQSWQDFTYSWSSSKFIPCFTTDLKLNIQKELNKKGFNFININTIRNPKRVFLEWCETGRGSRYDELDRMGKYYFNYKGMNIPGFAYSYKEKWFDSCPEERCYLVVSKYYEDFFSNDQSNAINIFFEDLVQDPLPEVMKVANHFNYKIKSNYKQMFELMNVPRVFDEDSYTKDLKGYYKKKKKIL